MPIRDIAGRSISRPWTYGLWVVCCAVLTACTASQPTQDKFRIAIDLRCTTCNDFLSCRASATHPSAVDPGFTVYRLGEKSFWGQIATIGDYLLQLWRPKLSDERPLTVYERRQGHWTVLRRGVARIDIAAARIELGTVVIDQRNGEWTADGTGGQCSVLPRREGFALVREVLGRPLPDSAHADVSKAGR
jgi:hypothetical protein